MYNLLVLCYSKDKKPCVKIHCVRSYQDVALLAFNQLSEYAYKEKVDVCDVHLKIHRVWDDGDISPLYGKNLEPIKNLLSFYIKNLITYEQEN